MTLPKLLEQMRARLAAATPPDSTVGDFRRFMDHAPTDLAFALDALEAYDTVLKDFATYDEPLDGMVAFTMRGFAQDVRAKIEALAKERGE